jgi:uncharacterized membrane protein YgaE (UPF0421/DUF939 family)
MKKNLLYLSIFLVISSLSLLIDAKNEEKNNKINVKKVDREDSSEVRQQSEVRQVEPEVFKAAIEVISEEEKQLLNLCMMEYMESMKKQEALPKSKEKLQFQEQMQNIYFLFLQIF